VQIATFSLSLPFIYLLTHLLTCRYNGQVLDTKYGPGSGRIWLDNVNCTGNETSISQCGHSGWGVHDNTHADDVSISCYFDSATEYAGEPVLLSYDCVDGGAHSCASEIHA